jgi:hypothetical protein
MKIRLYLRPEDHNMVASGGEGRGSEFELQHAEKN